MRGLHLQTVKTYFFAALLGSALYSCKSEEAPAPDTGSDTGCNTKQVSSAYVMATIQANCTSKGCHPGGNSPAEANFSSVNNLRSFIQDNENIFRLRVLSDNADMPPRGRLSKATRDSIGCWISNGMPE
jgi:hypothetical protein